MWLLKDPNGKIKYLRPGKTINVGRKQANIVLENDSSISRAHAEISITLKEQSRISEVSSMCIVKDVNSKYGTFIIRNKVQMRVSSEGLELEPSDTLKFGLQQHTFTVEYHRFVTVISRLSTDHKKKLKDIMDSIGGIVIDCYDGNCTHLTATTATSTNKIISALIAGIPIVDINYWTSVVNAINADDILPDSNLFTLPLQDKGVNTQRVSLKPNSVRKTLFQDKTFVFFSEKTHKEYKKMIKEAGGKVELRAINSESNQEDLLADNTIIMQMTDESMTDELAVFDAMLYEKMQQKKLRMIAETEIPLAIVYVSLDQYCNPKFNFKELMRRKSLQKDTSEILALDTQDILMSAPSNVDASIATSTLKQAFIPETEDFMQESIADVGKEASIYNINSNKAKIEKVDKSEHINHYDKKVDEFNHAYHDKKVDESKHFYLENSQKPTASEKQKIEIENLIDDAKFNDNKNINKKCLLNLENRKAKPKLKVANESNDFTELEKQKREMKEKRDMKKKNENKLGKLGFKKSEKKTLDFDLDDVDMEEPKKKIKKEISTQESNLELNVELNVKKNNKIFKKVYNKTPVNRIALSDMTIWRPNI